VYIIPVLVAAVAPGAALLSYFYLKDRYQTEPIRTVVVMFLLGAFLVLPIMALQGALVPGVNPESLWFSFGLSAGLEEFFKWFVIYFLIYKHAVFDEPYDGIVYAVAVSLGFATVENIFYAILHYSDFSTLLYRAFLPVSGHAMFGVTMGYYLGKAKFHDKLQSFYIGLSLLAPIFYHGTFDFILAKAKVWLWLAIPLMAFLWIRSLTNVNRANARSPFRTMQEEEVKI
jgi:RsiW-degrading membrane proteinase PrsW (M82 family)